MYTIIRTKKHKSIGSVKFRENHTYRRIETPNANPAKQHRNKVLFGQENYADGLEKFLADYKEAGNNIRKNGVLAIEYLLTASPEFFSEGSKIERDNRLKEWCSAQIDFMKKKHGDKNILCMYLHLDEKTPHIEAYIAPIDPKGRLNCKHFLGGKTKLRELQTEYADHNARFGLKRGMKSSRATHVQVQKFYEQIKSKAKVTSQELQNAVKIEIPTFSERLDPASFVEKQQSKIFNRIFKLFAGTVYENKMIEEAKQILRRWTQAEKTAKEKREKLEAEIESLHEKMTKQAKLILLVPNIKEENQELRKALAIANTEVQLLKSDLIPAKKSLAFK